MKRQNLDGKKALSRTVLGASWIDSLDGSDGKTGLAMSTPLEVYRLSKREAESSKLIPSLLLIVHKLSIKLLLQARTAVTPARQTMVASRPAA